MGEYIRQALEIIYRFNLDARNDEVAELKALLEQGFISDSLAQVHLDWLIEMTTGPGACRLLLPPPPRPEQWESLGKPDLELGDLTEVPGARFGIQLQGAQHTAVIGTTGCGKTFALRRIIQSAEQRNTQNPADPISIIAVESKSGDFADIPRLYGRRWVHLSTHNNMRIGLNGPRNLPPKNWIMYISACFAARAGLKASEVCLARMIEVLVEAMNPQPTTDLLWPSVSLIREVARTTPLSLFAAKPEYKKSLLQKLDAVADEPRYQTFNGFDLGRDITERHLSVVIDTCELEEPAWMRLFIMDCWIGQLLLSRQFHYKRTDRPNTIAIFDDVDASVSRESEASFPGGMTPMAHLLATGRESGLMAAFGLTYLGAVSHQITANLSNLFLMRSSDRDSLREAQRTLLLPLGSEAVLPILKVGECLARTSNGWPDVPLGQFDSVPPSRVESSQIQFDSFPFVPSQSLSELPRVQKALDELVKAHKQTQAKQARSSRPTLSKNSQKLLALTEGPVAAGGRCRTAPRPAFAKRRKLLVTDVLPYGWQCLWQAPPVHVGRGDVLYPS
jgi:hypothetical protein